MGNAFAKLRRNMVDNQLRTTDVTDSRVLDAMGSVPREAFVATDRQPLAYIDEDIRLDGNRFLMEPSPFAKLVQLAAIAKTDTVLDVGCASGYSSAVLSLLAHSVTALEEDATLAARATEILRAHGCDNVTVVTGPLREGYAQRAPYDVIFVGGSVGTPPEALASQLREGGRMAVVEGEGHAGAAWLWVRNDGVLSRRRAFNCAVKPLAGFAKPAQFVF
jgi:protein-L-isoaspartate(D-aspartate) O-methyltransferase